MVDIPDILCNFADDVLAVCVGAMIPSITSTIRTKASKATSVISSVKSSTARTTVKSWINQKIYNPFYSIAS